MGLSRYIECLVLTCLGWAPFLAVVNYKPDPMTDLYACTKPCHNIHYSRTETVPETTAAKLQLKNSRFLPSWDFPAFIAVENGRNFSAVRPQITWRGFLEAYHACPRLDLGSIWYQRVSQPGARQRACVRNRQRPEADWESSGPRATPLPSIFLSLVMWTLMKLAHDWALLAGVAEDFTLVIGVLSWAVSVAGILMQPYTGQLLWPTSLSPGCLSGNGACYYQLVPVATLTALGAALLLLYLTHVKMNNLVLSLVNYYCKIFSVPYGAVKGIAASQPLLTKGLHGDSDVLPAPAPHQQLEFRNRKRLCIFARSLYWFCLLSYGRRTVPFDFFGNLFLRVTELAVSQAWSLAPVVFLKLATLLAAAATPVIGGALAASVLVTVIQEALSDWRSLRAIDKLTVSAQLLLSTALLLLALSTSGGAWNITQAVVFHRGADGLQQHWEWYHHGKAIMYYVFFLHSVW